MLNLLKIGSKEASFIIMQMGKKGPFTWFGKRASLTYILSPLNLNHAPPLMPVLALTFDYENFTLSF